MAYVLNSGDTASVKVIMSANNGSIRWANTHEYLANQQIDPADQLQAATQIANAYRNILLPPYRVERVVISSWVPDGRPYNPDTFNVFPFNLAGDRTRSGSEPVDLTICLSYTRVPTGGRQGRMLLRGILTEEMLVWQAGRYNFAEPAGLDGVDFRAAEQQLVGLTSLLAGGLSMVMQSQSFLRGVSRIIRGSIVFKKLNNKYFNRLR